MAFVPGEPVAPAEPATPGGVVTIPTPIGSVTKRLCLGMNVVPYTTVLVFDEQGEYEILDFVDLSCTSGGYALFSWLWQPLGFSKEQWARSQPWQLPLMKELKEAVSGRRVKRNRQGQFLNAEGNLNAKVISATIRGMPHEVALRPSQDHGALG